MIDIPAIAIHQINTVTGDIEGNRNRIITLLEKDIKKDVSVSIFPETAITGYMCGALWDTPRFLKDQEYVIYEIQTLLQEKNHGGYVIIGYVRYPKDRKNGYPLLYNSVAVIGKNYFETYDKIVLADADHHEDKKYFSAGKEIKVFDLKFSNKNNLRVGIPICEDMWYIDHDRNIPQRMVREYGADLIININQSYFSYGKQKRRFELISNFAREYEVPVVYCNSIGVGDIVKNIVTFDGGSMIVNKRGELLYQAPRFEEESAIEYNWVESIREFNESEKYKEITDCLIFEQLEFFRLNGIKKAQVHISGGIDSAIVAALVQKAMGKENTVLITNPTELNSRSEKYVKQLMNALDNKAWVQPLQKIYDTFMEFDYYTFGEDLSETGCASVQATLRTVQGIAASHRFGSGIVSTGNHTEIVLGWASFHDIGSIGVHALIGDLTKMELYELARYINDILYKKEIIPEDLLNGNFKPSAELPDAPMEDPIDYEIYSGICALMIRDRKSIPEIAKLWHRFANTGEIDDKLVDYFPNSKAVCRYSFQEFLAHVTRAHDMMKRSVYKAAQGAPIVIISPRSRGFSNRETLINKY